MKYLKLVILLLALMPLGNLLAQDTPPAQAGFGKGTGQLKKATTTVTDIASTFALID